MSKQIIIALGREFGSGGHEIGEKLAKELGISFYDRKLLDELAERYGLDPKELEKHDEKARNPFLSRKVRGHSNSIAEAVAELQFNFIREKADSGESFVIVGRVAEVILADREELVSVFVLGDVDTKIVRVMKKYNLDREEAITKMKRHDKKRKAYHNNYSKFSWGDSREYHLCINSSVLGVDKTVDIVKQFVLAKKGLMEGIEA